MTWRALLPAALALGLLACSSADPTSEAAPGQTTSSVPASSAATTPTSETAAPLPSTTPKPEVMASWSNDELPAPASGLAACGSTLLYQTIVDQTLFLVGVDGAAGQERFRLATDPGSILGGQTGHPEVDCERGQAYLITPEGTAAAVDVASGEVRWTTFQDEVGQLSVCGGDLCALTQARLSIIEHRFDAADGAFVARIRLQDGRVLASADDFRLFAVGDEVATGPTALTGYRVQEEQWTMPIDDIVDLVGHRFTPSTGWHGRPTSDPDVRVQYLGPALDEEQSGEDRVTAGGVVFAYRLSTGEVVWARDNLVACGMAEDLVCHFDGYTDGTYDLSTLERLDLETGQPLWTLPAEDRRPQVVRIGDDLRLTYYDDFQPVDILHVDADNGTLLPEPTPRAYSICWNWDSFTGPADLDLSAYSTVLGESRSWTPPDLLYPCRDDGGIVDDPEVIASEPELIDQFGTAGADGWRFFSDGARIQGLQLDG